MAKSKLDDLQSVKKQLEKLREDAKTKCKDVFEEVSKELFDKHPKLESFSFYGYTPYFNDGDACTFSAYIDYPEINGISTRRQPDELEKTGLSKKEIKSIDEDVSKLLHAFDDEDYQNMFDDHWEVTVTRKGIEVGRYEHE